MCPWRETGRAALITKEMAVSAGVSWIKAFCSQRHGIVGLSCNFLVRRVGHLFPNFVYVPLLTGRLWFPGLAGAKLSQRAVASRRASVRRSISGDVTVLVQRGSLRMRTII